MTPFDTVIISSDTCPKFIDFWPYVRSAWQRIYPEVQIVLVVVAEHAYPGARWLKALPGIPVPNQTKLARYWIAGQEPASTVCSLNDIDFLPINREYIDTFLSGRPAGCLVRMGAELYTGPEKGKATSGYLTAEASVWKSLTNPDNLAWEPWLRQFVGFRVFDHKEDISSPIYYENPNCFSDESWLRAMLSLHPVPVQDRPRGYYPYTARALCRSNWHFDPKLIQAGTIVEAHLLRPLADHRDQLNLLFQLLNL